MDWFSGFVVYVLIWWMTLFCVLPWGIQRDQGLGAGHGAPANPRLMQKFLVTTGISFLLWLLVYYLIVSDIIDFRALSFEMMEKDKL